MWSPSSKARKWLGMLCPHPRLAYPPSIGADRYQQRNRLPLIDPRLRYAQIANKHLHSSRRELAVGTPDHTVNASSATEDAMRTRMPRSTESLDMHARSLTPLSLGDKVFLQNERGSHPKKWDKSGTVVELGNYDQYWVKVNGSGRLTLRNRRFLRKFVPPSLTIGDPLSHSHQPYGLATRDSLPPTRSESPQMTTSLPQVEQQQKDGLSTPTKRLPPPSVQPTESVRASPRLDRGGADRRSASIVIHPTSYTG